MNESDIRKYAGLMQELGLTGLEITEGDRVVRLEKNAPAPARETIVVDAGTAPAVSAAEAAAPKTGESADYISVKSPLVGVFYAAPAENADPYVSMGDQVKTGQVLCVIEAMKLMNEISAEVDGTVLEICVTNGQMVEFGTELFRIRK
ncbi:MAG TPA: acetyl-CoA carboxylase biotin carboxyl carrier protein [Lachnospiraceae bacterium]|nr:acetyl-CoA carboxylase biotin carboxyl carrier protein [Lachnospiraceae bacterium]